MSFARLSVLAVVVVAAVVLSVSWPEPALSQKKSGKKGADAVAAGKELSATPVTHIKVKKDFKVELLYSVPARQGSWVSLTVDPKGRLITSDQYGKLYRVTPPRGRQEDRSRATPRRPRRGPGPALGVRQPYVVVNRGSKYESGLYRVSASKGDDKLDKVELLRAIRRRRRARPARRRARPTASRSSSSPATTPS